MQIHQKVTFKNDTKMKWKLTKNGFGRELAKNCLKICTHKIDENKQKWALNGQKRHII